MLLPVYVLGGKLCEDFCVGALKLLSVRKLNYDLNQDVLDGANNGNSFFTEIPVL